MRTEEQKKIETAREALRLAIENQHAKRKTSKAQLITELRSEIVLMRTQGWTWEAIAEALRGSINASPATIRRSIGAKHKSKVSNKPKTEPLFVADPSPVQVSTPVHIVSRQVGYYQDRFPSDADF